MNRGKIFRGANRYTAVYRKGTLMSPSHGPARRKSNETAPESQPLTVDHETLDWDGPMAEDNTQVVANVRLRVRLHPVADAPLPLAD
jgi:hypothetical protein